MIEYYHMIKLECDCGSETCRFINEIDPPSFYGYSLIECRNKARKKGWIFKANGEVISPECAYTVKRK